MPRTSSTRLLGMCASSSSSAVIRLAAILGTYAGSAGMTSNYAQPSSTPAGCLFYLVVVADYPVVEQRDRLCKGGSERRERILDAWWYFVVIMPPDQSVSLKLAQRL